MMDVMTKSGFTESRFSKKTNVWNITCLYNNQIFHRPVFFNAPYNKNTHTINKGNNTITELRTILQRESQNS